MTRGYESELLEKEIDGEEMKMRGTGVGPVKGKTGVLT